MDIKSGKTDYKLFLESQENNAKIKLDETCVNKVTKLSEKKESLLKSIKELEEEIKYLTELGTKKAQLDEAKTKVASIKEEINTIKNNKVAVVDEEIEEKDILEEQPQMTNKGHIPGTSKEIKDPNDALKQKKKITESAWDNYKKLNKKSTVTKDDIVKFTVAMG